MLAAILGAHSKIIAAGELRWLIEENYFDLKKLIEGSKKLTKQHSVPFQDETFQAVNYSNVYKKVFEKFSSNCIVDSSKEPSYFSNIIKETTNDHFQFLFIALWKHPIRLLSSHLMHRWDKLEKFKNYKRMDAIGYVINAVYNRFLIINNFLTGLKNGNKFLHIKYEDIVENLQMTLCKILDEINLRYENNMQDYEQSEQFLLGGNAGPRYQITKSQNGLESNFESSIHREFYQDLNGIKMDSNYKKFFSQDEIHLIYENKQIKNMMNFLDYSNIF